MRIVRIFPFLYGIALHNNNNFGFKYLYRKPYVYLRTSLTTFSQMNWRERLTTLRLNFELYHFKCTSLRQGLQLCGNKFLKYEETVCVFVSKSELKTEDCRPNEFMWIHRLWVVGQFLGLLRLIVSDCVRWLVDKGVREPIGWR